MCRDCGCEQGNERAYFHGHADAHGNDHGHAHDHPHAHGHDHAHDHGNGNGLDHHREEGDDRHRIDVEMRVLAHNDHLAAHNREWLDARGVFAVNLISSPGSGKTLLLERTLERMARHVACAVVVGDQQTDNDARRLAGKGAPVRQIETKSSCHLDAERVGGVLPEVVTEGTRLLFIENVGNLVCPAAFELGEHFKIALLSVAEGEDKPIKYPVLFSRSPVVVLTKMDLLPHLDFDMARCRRNIRTVRPDAKIFELSARTGEGMESWTDYLFELARTK
ncbi:MAG: hydrogenase nickel incorporation protein HypB [Deltaproteobacteria bacterium]|nr:hydrogenase nickel incorporation protein HypB [Deltaproteobacteria bacterium]